MAVEFSGGVTIPLGMVVAHACDNPPCCNPRHLSIEMPNKNIAEMIERGRMRGRRDQRRPLTAKDANEIRGRAAHGERPASLAATFGVTRSMISKIVNGQTWR